MTQLVTAGNVTSTQLMTAVTTSNTQIHNTVMPFIVAIQKEEDEFEHLAVVTPEIRDAFVTQIQLIIEVIKIVVIHHHEHGDGD